MLGKLKAALLMSLHKSIYKPGHYYSPIPDRDYVMSKGDRIFSVGADEVAGVDLNVAGQLALAAELAASPLPYDFGKGRGSHLYDPHNGEFILPDAWALFTMMEKFAPKRVIEIGSGYSSAVMMDWKSAGDKEVDLLFIEPNPGRFLGLLEGKSLPDHTFVRKFVQDVELEVFTQLEENDLLFIDCSHVGKIGSDLNFLLFEVLPRLQKGVIVHFHDITYPFEYPKEWFQEGRYWNEAYLVRALLTSSVRYGILLFNHFLGIKHPEALPAAVKKGGHLGGGSLYLRVQG